MVRSKVKLEFIEDDSARRVSFGKRSKGVLKKVSELSTLCDVQACAVVYGPYSEMPKVWPSPDGAKEVLTRFKGMPEYKKDINVVNQEVFTNEMIAKKEKELQKLYLENRHEDLTRLMYKCLRGEGIINPSMEDLRGIMSVTKEKIDELKTPKLGISDAGGSENSKGKEQVEEEYDDQAKGDDTPNRTEGGNFSQGVESSSVINNTTMSEEMAQMSKLWKI